MANYFFFLGFFAFSPNYLRSIFLVFTFYLFDLLHHLFLHYNPYYRNQSSFIGFPISLFLSKYISFADIIDCDSSLLDTQKLFKYNLSHLSTANDTLTLPLVYLFLTSSYQVHSSILTL